MYTPGCVILLISSSIIALVDGAPKYTKHHGHKGEEFNFNRAGKRCMYKFIILPYPLKS